MSDEHDAPVIEKTETGVETGAESKLGTTTPQETPKTETPENNVSIIEAKETKNVSEWMAFFGDVLKDHTSSLDIPNYEKEQFVNLTNIFVAFMQNTNGDESNYVRYGKHVKDIQSTKPELITKNITLSTGNNLKFPIQVREQPYSRELVTCYVQLPYDEYIKQQEETSPTLVISQLDPIERVNPRKQGETLNIQQQIQNIERAIEQTKDPKTLEQARQTLKLYQEAWNQTPITILSIKTNKEPNKNTKGTREKYGEVNFYLFGQGTLAIEKIDKNDQKEYIIMPLTSENHAKIEKTMDIFHKKMHTLGPETTKPRIQQQTTTFIPNEIRQAVTQK